MQKLVESMQKVSVVGMYATVVASRWRASPAGVDLNVGQSPLEDWVAGVTAP